MSPAGPARADAPRSALEKVVAVLEAVADEHRISDIARRTGLPVSTAHRIVAELVPLGWVRPDGEHGYVLGPRLLALSGRASGVASVTSIARPFLEDLSGRTGHTVHFALLSGDEAVYVDKIEGRRAYQMRSRVGLSIPLHCTAIGKAVLAALPEARARDLLARVGTPRRTPRTITGRDRVLAHLAVVRERGYSVDDEENEEQTRCLGAAVLDGGGLPVGGISLSSLVFDLDEDAVAAHAPLVRRAAEAVTAALGGRTAGS